MMNFECWGLRGKSIDKIIYYYGTESFGRKRGRNLRTLHSNLFKINVLFQFQNL